MENEIVAKVTGIIDSKTLLINKGFLNSELKKGETLKIFEPGPEITDVETNEVLGRYDFVKDRVEIVEMFEKYSICKKKVKESSGISNALTPLLMSSTYYYGEMDIDSDDSRMGEVTNPKITVGDPLKK